CAASGDPDDEEGNRDVLARERDEGEGVEELVVAKDARCGVGSPAGVDDRAGSVGEAASCEKATAAIPAVSASWASATTPTQPRGNANTTESHFGPRTQQILVMIAAAAPVQTTASTIRCRVPCGLSRPTGV